MAARTGKTKAQRVAADVAAAVGAGRAVAVETVDFSDPDRPPTCLEVDFPIVPVNQVAVIEGNAGKPIYQMSKWWARRRSSVFRSLLLAASMKSPEDRGLAAKAVWDVYYANHAKKGTLAGLRVADIFMGGGTTLVEGARLGLELWGCDLNPVAWFVTKNELARVSRDEVEALLADVRSAVRPQIMPFYACDCPRGHSGVWRRHGGAALPRGFDPLELSASQRAEYDYEGPEIVYAFWVKHGPCPVLGCGHRTPILSSPVVAVKELTVRAWPQRCAACRLAYDLEMDDARMAPGVPLVVAETETPFAVAGADGSGRCPACGALELAPSLSGKPLRKKIALSLLVHPEWMRGESATDAEGRGYGGSVADPAEATSRWNRARATRVRLVEVRGALPPEVTCPETGVRFSTARGTVPKGGHFECGSCGAVSANVAALEASGSTAPAAILAIQGHCPACDREARPYGGRFFVAQTSPAAFDAAAVEWEERRDADLAGFWPRSEIPFGHMTHQRQPLPQHGYKRWADMFNPRQLLVHTQLLRAVVETGGDRHRMETREFVLGAFQQYLRNQNMFCFWNPQRDTLEPMFSNNNFHPKATLIENCVFGALGRGNWDSCSEALTETCDWRDNPWDVVSNDRLGQLVPAIAKDLTGKSEKAFPLDTVHPERVTLACTSSTELPQLGDESFDLVVTDPPFGGNLHYAELADFFYVWLQLVLAERYPDAFGPEYSPKALEAVSNKARHPEDPNGWYRRLLTACWREAHRILKPAGLLAFTFHHSEDEPWVDVLESLFEAGFYLEATYPIRSDETKGEGEFGSKKIEYDIIHVCRKRTAEPAATSWARMRREVLREVRELRQLLEHHEKEGLPAADLQVIRRGKALEYFSRHYGRVFVDAERTMPVTEALAGINQLLDEEAGGVTQAPPPMAEPMTRQILRLFDGTTEVSRDQMHKFLRGTGLAAGDFEAAGWCVEEKKSCRLRPFPELAAAWYRRPREKMLRDFDQAAFLIGACFDNSGIDVLQTLRNESFRLHPAARSVLEWFQARGADAPTRAAAARAAHLMHDWMRRQPREKLQLELELGEIP